MMSAEKQSKPGLEGEVRFLRGIGSERAARLERLGIVTVKDLLFHRPRRYEDRRNIKCIRDAVVREAGTFCGRIVDQGEKRFRRRRGSLFEFIIEDGTGRLHCRWWNVSYMNGRFNTGDEVVVFGKVSSKAPLAIDHPETEVVGDDSMENSVHIGRIVPIYPLTEGLTQRWLRAVIWNALLEYSGFFDDASLVDRGSCDMSAAEAVRRIHFPEASEDVEKARTRLALEEFVGFQLELQRRRLRLMKSAKGLRCPGDNSLVRPFLRKLGFDLTGPQKRVLREIRADMSETRPMRRLLQGDVGAGKTVVAACAALMAVESGRNVALMAPTEILAEQHYRVFCEWFGDLDVGVDLVTGHRRLVGEAPGRRIVIGTHALIQEKFLIENLGLVVIDEQHRFGVMQRQKLVRKGVYPHLLVMTATPIPRTLGLTVYGDLDISLIDGLPPGRGRVRSFVRGPERLPKVWDFMQKKFQQGRQAYIVYPLIDESEKMGLKSVKRERKRLELELNPYRVGLLHGEMSSEEKARVMDEFRRGTVHALLSTPVVEVGLDVPNATVMLVENAERFGLAQLHQLRGRLCRGEHESFFIMVSETKTADARRRLGILEETSDGFRIAEADMMLRGPGEFLGMQQSGLPSFKFGSLTDDLELIKVARELALEILSGGTALNMPGGCA
ncbi:MAG: ATP-dependent DNA helicase RecG [Verrucomicrobia bacterium]|nr:ATP-dependent DNA helicase RecG [Verrucomicrobiota bacterium]MCF7709356.1 ATP-dependent DNA helicase RecG [Verrucomicrobiota bacterium]